MSYLGDFALGATVDAKFTTIAPTTGLPTALSSGAVSAYIGNGTTELTAGITLTASFDSVTGLNHVRVVASSGNGYATATDVMLVLTAGTVGGTSVAGYVVGEFSIENRPVASLSAASLTALVAAVGALVIEGTTTLIQSQRLANSANAGLVSGAGTTNVKIRDLANTKDRIDATVDADGNRTAITRDVT